MSSVNNQIRTAPTNYNYVGSLVAFDLHYPSVDTSLTRPFGTQMITGLLDKLGAMNPVSAIKYTHFEEDRLHTVVYGTATAGSADASVTVTLGTSGAVDSIYAYPTSVQAPYVVAGTAYATPIQVNDIVMFKNGVKGLVTAATYSSSATFAVSPIVSGQNIPDVASGDPIIIIGSAWGEGTDQGLSRQKGLTEYTNNLMIHKRQNLVTGTEMANKTWVEFKGENLWYLESQFDESRRFNNELEMLCLLGEKLTNTTLAGSVPTTTITEGLFSWIENYGNTQNFNSNAGFQLADLDALVSKLTQNKGAQENYIYTGLGLNQSIDNFLDSSFQNGGVQYNAFSGIGGKDRAIEFGFDSFKRTNFTFHKMLYTLFTDNTLLGAIPSYNNYGVVIPAGNTTAADQSGAKLTVPSLRLNYQSVGGYSRKQEEWFTGAANGVYTNTSDSVQMNMRATRGFEGFGPNRFATISAA